MPKHYLGIVACRPSAHMPKNATMLCPATLDGSVDIGGQYNDALVSDERRDFWFAEVAFKLCAFGEKTDGGQPCANATEREEYLSGLPTVNIWTKTRRALGAKSDWGSEYYQQLDFSTWNEINSYYAITKETKGTRSGLGVEVMPLWPRYEGYETKSSTNTNLFDGEEFLEIFFRRVCLPLLQDSLLVFHVAGSADQLWSEREPCRHRLRHVYGSKPVQSPLEPGRGEGADGRACNQY